MTLLLSWTKKSRWLTSCSENTSTTPSLPAATLILSLRSVTTCSVVSLRSIRNRLNACSELIFLLIVATAYLFSMRWLL
ncbi:Uncharacterised protein [Mycobacterium tuberculosis]|nr:Uncharacterised protein [Mycobacterium tuberculosis]